MKLCRQDRIAYSAIAVLFVGFLAYCAVRYSLKHGATNVTIEDHIRHADTFYWFGMAGRGYMSYLHHGQEELEHAQHDAHEKRRELELKKAALAESGFIEIKALHDIDEQIERLDVQDERIKGTEQDLNYQIVLHHDTFHGVFPWAHYMALPTLFKDPRATGLYELNDKPGVIAARAAVRDLVEQVLDHQTMRAQFDAVFVADPRDFADPHAPTATEHSAEPHEGTDAEHRADPDGVGDKAFAAELENEALYLFNLDPRIFVHNMLEVATSLDESEQEELRALEPSEETLAKLSREWGHQDLLLVRIKKLDEVDNYHFYSAQGRLFSANSSVPVAVYNNYGFCSDRSFILPDVIVFNLLMFVTAVVLFRGLAHSVSPDGLPPNWRTSLGLGGLGFLWGRVAVWGLAEVVEEFVPGNEHLAYLSFWWPAVAGFVMLLGPSLIMRFAESRFGWLDRTFGLVHRRGALFAAVAVGSTAYIGQVALWVRYWGGWPVLPPLILATIVAAWILGRALDATDPVASKWGVIMAALALGIGLAFANAYPDGAHPWKLWAAAAPILYVGGLATRRSGYVLRPATSPDAAVQRGERGGSKQALMQLAMHPPYQETRSFRSVRECLDKWEQGETVRIQLVGSAGTGKTAILSELRRVYGNGAAVMSGDCPESQHGAVAEPYHPFAEAIADHFSVNLLAHSKEGHSEIDKAVDHLFDEVVPFSDLLFPPGRGEGASGSKRELYASVAAMLRHLAQKRPLMLVIDDAHWIDAGSRELLEFLLTEFPAGAANPIAVIVATRSADSQFAAEETITLEPLTTLEVRDLLINGLHFAPAAAGELADALGDGSGNLHWLFQMVSDLAARDLLEWTPDGWRWPAETTLAEHVPDDMRQSIRDVLDANPEFRHVLECAACMGPEFNIEVLSPAVDMSRLQCIRVLDRIEAATGFIRDVQEDDVTFAFRSPFMLEVMRELLNVSAAGPTQPSPKRIREFHARLAGAWESTLDQSSVGIYRLATHRYAAGARHAARATQELLNSARAASAQFQHEQARQYLQMARECAAVAGQSTAELERELLLIEAHEAHVDGRHRGEVAERLRTVIAEGPDADFAIYGAAALACYDAGIDTRNPESFDDCVRIGQAIVERFTEPLQQAYGHHFIGVALPLSERDGRRRSLETALRLVDEDDHIEALRLKSRLLNSLAEQLSYGSEDDRRTARKLFLRSIELKERPELRDIEGLAIAHGGLGRLEFFDPHPNFAEARAHFEEDLRYSERVGSRTSQSKMHSLLGACDIRQNEDFRSAFEHYEQALELAEEVVDRYFALGGLLRCAGSLSDEARTSHYGKQLRDVIRANLERLPQETRASRPAEAVPEMCRDALQAGLDACHAQREADWHRWVSVLITENRIVE